MPDARIGIIEADPVQSLDCRAANFRSDANARITRGGMQCMLHQAV